MIDNLCLNLFIIRYKQRLIARQYPLFCIKFVLFRTSLVGMGNSNFRSFKTGPYENFTLNALHKRTLSNQGDRVWRDR